MLVLHTRLTSDLNKHADTLTIQLARVLVGCDEQTGMLAWIIGMTRHFRNVTWHVQIWNLD